MADKNKQEGRQQLPPRAQLLKMLVGSWVAQSIYVAAKLELADHLSREPMTPKSLAEKTGMDENALYRVLRGLASVGVFKENDDGQFISTPIGDYLKAGREDSIRSLAVMMGEEFYQAWGNFLYSVETGQPAFDKVYGKSLFEHFQESPTAGASFDLCMATVHGAESEGVVDSYDFSAFNKIIDVGGGNGAFLSTVLKEYPTLNGVIFDLPTVIQRATETIAQYGLDQRCEFIQGDFTQSVPAGGDIYVLRHIIHDWNDEKAGVILANCRKVMPPAAKLLIIESVIPSGNEWSASKFLDLHMLAISGGQERTGAQYDVLLKNSGFKMTNVIPTKVKRLSIVEAELEP